MAYPTIDEFKNIVLSQPLDSVVQNYIFQGVPYVFREKPDILNILIQHLCKAMPLQGKDISVVGSAKVGFSLNPDNFPRSFSDASDIDVIVVSESLFDKVWMTLLEWHYPRRSLNLGNVEGNWARLRRKDIYFGWIVPDEIQYEGISFPDILTRTSRKRREKAKRESCAKGRGRRHPTQVKDLKDEVSKKLPQGLATFPRKYCSMSWL